MPTVSDDLLDEALRLTFPASDPIAITPDPPRLKLVLFGGLGELGRRIAREATARGHELTVRAPVDDAAAISSAVQGFDAVIAAEDATAPSPTALTEGLTRAGVRRLLVVGGQDPSDDEALQRYRTAELNWTYLSPMPGARNARVNDTIAISALDELEYPRHLRQQVSIAT